MVDCPEIGKIFLNHGVTGPHEAVVWVALRPEKMILCKPGTAMPSNDPDGANQASGQIKGMSYLGDCTIFEIRLASGRMIRVSRANISRSDRQDFTWDDQVALYWHASSPVVLQA